MTNIARKRWPFLYIRQGEIELLKFLGLPIYKHVGAVYWCLGFLWVNAK